MNDNIHPLFNAVHCRLLFYGVNSGRVFPNYDIYYRDGFESAPFEDFST